MKALLILPSRIVAILFDMMIVTAPCVLLGQPVGPKTQGLQWNEPLIDTVVKSTEPPGLILSEEFLFIDRKGDTTRVITKHYKYDEPKSRDQMPTLSEAGLFTRIWRWITSNDNALIVAAKKALQDSSEAYADRLKRLEFDKVQAGSSSQRDLVNKSIDSLKSDWEKKKRTLERSVGEIKRDMAALDLEDGGLWFPWRHIEWSRLFFENKPMSNALKALTGGRLGYDGFSSEESDALESYIEIGTYQFEAVRLAVAAFLPSVPDIVMDSVTSEGSVRVISEEQIKTNALTEFLGGGGNVILNASFPLVHWGSLSKMFRATANVRPGFALPGVGVTHASKIQVAWNVNADLMLLADEWPDKASIYATCRINWVGGLLESKKLLGLPADESISYAQLSFAIALPSDFHFSFGGYWDFENKLGDVPLTFNLSYVR